MSQVCVLLLIKDYSANLEPRSSLTHEYKNTGVVTEVDEAIAIRIIQLVRNFPSAGSATLPAGLAFY